MADTPEAIYLEGIWVNPQERGKNYGLRCLTQVARKLLKRTGSLCVLVNENNLKAHAFYRRAGFKPRGSYQSVYLQSQLTGTKSMSTMGRERLAKLYLWVVVTAGASAVLFSAYRLPLAKLDLQLGLLALLTVAVTSRVRINIPRLTSEISVSDTFIFLILLLYGGEAAVLVATADALIQTSRFGRKLKTFLFNAAMLACATFLTGEVVRYSFQHFPNLNYEVFSGNYLIVLCVMVLVQYIVNTGLAAIYSRSEKRSTSLANLE